MTAPKEPRAKRTRGVPGAQRSLLLTQERVYTDYGGIYRITAREQGAERCGRAGDEGIGSWYSSDPNGKHRHQEGLSKSETQLEGVSRARASWQLGAKE